MRKLTVSDFIRESKPGWEPVCKQERRNSTGVFTGAMQVQTGATAILSSTGRVLGATVDMSHIESFESQVEMFDQQNLSGSTEGPEVVCGMGSRVPQ